MNLFDPNRRRNNDKPELLGRHFVVPRLSIFPNETSSDQIQISAMIPDDRGGKFNSRQVMRSIPASRLPALIEAYRHDPEFTLETLFETTLAPLAEPSDTDLIRDLRRASQPKPTPRQIHTIAEIEL